jgi:hypothetical protein
MRNPGQMTLLRLLWRLCSQNPSARACDPTGRCSEGASRVYVLLEDAKADAHKGRTAALLIVSYYVSSWRRPPEANQETLKPLGALPTSAEPMPQRLFFFFFFFFQFADRCACTLRCR